MILEKEYSYFYWLHVDLTKEEFQSFTHELNQINDKHLIKLIDCLDEEEQDICFRFDQCKPRKPQEIKWAKVMNEKHCKKFMSLLSKKIDGKLYFNVNHKVIKRK